MRRISVVIADDHHVVRRGLKALLQSEDGIEVVGEAADGLEALEAVKAGSPDVLVLDLAMPTLRGIDVLRALTAAGSRTHVVVLSMHGDLGHVGEAFQSGAAAYVVKDASASDLVDAVREAAAGRRFVSPPFTLSEVDDYVHGLKDEAADPYDLLTLREREVLLLSVNGCTSQEIADRLTISRRTAESHRANLMRKLGVKNHHELVQYAVRKRILEL